MLKFSSEEIEHLLVTKYRKSLYAPFKKAIQAHDLIAPGATIALGISGGKDSLLMAKLMQQLQRENAHTDKAFELVFIAMDPGYQVENRTQMEANVKALGIPAIFYEKDVFEASMASTKLGATPCYMCARMRRGVLYDLCETHGATTLALGHHYDDVIETILLNILCAGQFMTMLPKLESEKRPHMTLIRPLYYIEEQAIKRFTHFIGLKPMACGCSVTAYKGDSKRKQIKELIENLTKTFPNVKNAIFHSAKNVNLKYILGLSEPLSLEKDLFLIDALNHKRESRD